MSPKRRKTIVSYEIKSLLVVIQPVMLRKELLHEL